MARGLTEETARITRDVEFPVKANAEFLSRPSRTISSFRLVMSGLFVVQMRRRKSSSRPAEQRRTYCCSLVGRPASSGCGCMTSGSTDQPLSTPFSLSLGAESSLQLTKARTANAARRTPPALHAARLFAPCKRPIAGAADICSQHTPGPNFHERLTTTTRWCNYPLSLEQLHHRVNVIIR